MRTKSVTRHYCDHCGKGKFSRKWMERHERHCYKNPDRVPYEGELTYSRQMGKVVNFGTDDNLPSGLSWLEWVPHDQDKMPKWWPGEPGLIFHDGAWAKVPGYQQHWPTGAHGYAGGPPPDDEWPKTESGCELNKVGAAYRWEVLQRSIGPILH